MTCAPKIIISVLSSLIAAVLATFFLASPAHATGPALPAGDALHAYGYYNTNSQEATLNPTNAAVTIINPAVAPSALEYAEGAGYDAVTDKTWLVTDNGICHIWSLASTGAVEDKYNVKTIASNPSIDKCWALMTNGDGTAWVSAENTSIPAHYLMKVNLVTGALIGSVLTPTQAITGMSKDPTTGQMWASCAANGSTPGLYKLDLTTAALTDRINTSSLAGTPDVWDIAFDSSGRLWMSVWGGNAELASIVPTATTPLTTYQNSGGMMLAGSAWDSDALWFRPAASSPTSTPSSALAATGLEGTVPVFSVLIALQLVVSGAGLMVVKRARR